MYKEKAEEYVRNHPDNKELMGNPCTDCDEATIPHLEHYLRVLAKVSYNFNIDARYAIFIVGVNKTQIHFKMSTGAPATEKDAEEFMKLCSV